MTVMNRKSNFRAEIHYFSDENANIVDFRTSKTVIFRQKSLFCQVFMSKIAKKTPFFSSSQRFRMKMSVFQ